MSLDQQARSILFFVPFGDWQVHTQLDLAVAFSAQARHLGTTFVKCDAFYQPCAMDRRGNVCKVCQAAMGDIASQFGISGEALSGLMVPEEIARAEAWVQGLDDASLTTAIYEGLEVGDWAISSVMTHFRIGNLADLRRDTIIPVHRRFLRDTLLTFWAIGRIIDRDRIDAMFLFNGRIYPYRAAFEAARRRGIRVLVHERGRTANTFSFFENENCLSPRTANELVAAWSHEPLDERQLGEVEQHFSGLLRGRSTTWPSFYDQILPSDPRAMLDIPAGVPLVAFFTSSSDEIASQISFAKITSQFALIENLAIALERAGAYLIVRHHPHIGGGPVESPVEPSAFFEAYAHCRTRRPNVRVIMPKDEISSYALFTHLKAVFAPFTSLGLETTAFGIPTFVAQNAISSFHTHYSIDDWSISGLQRKVDFALSEECELKMEDFRVFYRTFFSRFNRFSLSFAAVSMKDYVEPLVNPGFAALLQPGKDVSTEQLFDYLIEGKHVYTRPATSTSVVDVDLTSEDRFISRHLGAIAARRRPERVLLEREKMPNGTNAAIAILCEDGTGQAAFVEGLRSLPNASHVSILSFRVETMKGWRKMLARVPWLGDAFEFRSWARSILEALRRVSENRVIVISRRYQLHDAAIATIINHLRQSPPAPRQMVTLSAWFADVAGLNPARISASTLKPADWRKLRRDRLGVLRVQDLLAIGLLDKTWLRSKLRSARHLEQAFFNELDKAHHVAARTPVMLWHYSQEGEDADSA